MFIKVLIISLLLCSSIYAQEIVASSPVEVMTKRPDGTMSVSITTTTVKIISIARLKERKALLQKSIDRIKEQIAELDAQIAKAKELGVTK